MNLNEWEASIFSVINEISDKNYQKSVWFEGVEGDQSSFTEAMCALYDEYDFEGFIEYQLKEKTRSEEFFSTLKDFNQEVNLFLRQIGDQAVTKDLLEDPRWKEIQFKAQKLNRLRT